jgi:glutathione-specific gamma-glutamylcyclotransferase
MKPVPRQMNLTPELVAKIHRIEPDEGPRPHLQQMDDADYREYTQRLLDELGDAPLRVFAYGSLIWKAEFEYVQQTRATLKGWHRSFCMKIERWRGTRVQPGLMMALDRGGSCAGVVYELPAGDQNTQLERLLRREMTNKPPTNKPLWLQVETQGEKFRALAFTASRSGHSYQDKLSLNEIAAILARAAGHWGSGAEYLYNTVSRLEQLGIHDRNLWQLQKLVAEEIEKQN